MSPGFGELDEVCRELDIAADLGPPAPNVPPSLFGQPLDDTLERFYRAHDGGWWSSRYFYLRIYPLEGPDALAWRNTSLRRTDQHGVNAYPYDRLLTFAQIGRRAAYLATVPGVRGRAKRQPVIYLDDSEIPWAIPVAASVDGAFRLLAAYLRSASASAGLAGLEGMAFPLQVPELVGADHELRDQVRRGDLHALFGDDWVRDWIANTFA